MLKFEVKTKLNEVKNLWEELNSWFKPNSQLSAKALN